MTDSVSVVFGAGGGTGRSIVTELVRLRRNVRAVYHHRPEHLPTGVEAIEANAADEQGVRAATLNASVVYHAVNVPYQRWVQDLPGITGNLAAAAEAAGARFVYADNLYCYGDTGGAPMSETTPQAPSGVKGRLRKRLADELLKAHVGGRLAVVIARSADYYGPGGVNTFAGDRVFGAVVKGKSPSFLGLPGTPHTYSYLEDIGRAMVLLADRDAALGAVWHLPHADPLTGEAFSALISEAIGRPVRASYTPRLLLALAGAFVPLVREVKEQEYQFTHPYLVDSTKFERAFGPFQVTPHREAIARTLEWFRSRERGAG